MTGIFLLHAFKDLDFGLADLPKVTKPSASTSGFVISSKYTKIEPKNSSKRIENLEKADHRIHMYDDNEEDSAVLLIESLTSKTSAGSLQR